MGGAEAWLVGGLRGVWCVFSVLEELMETKMEAVCLFFCCAFCVKKVE